MRIKDDNEIKNILKSENIAQYKGAGSNPQYREKNKNKNTTEVVSGATILDFLNHTCTRWAWFSVF